MASRRTPQTGSINLSRIEKLEIEIAALKVQVNTNSSEIATLRTKTHDLSNSIQPLMNNTNEIAQLRNQTQALSLTFQPLLGMKDILSILPERVAGIQKEISELPEQVKKLQIDMVSFQAQQKTVVAVLGIFAPILSALITAAMMKFIGAH